MTESNRQDRAKIILLHLEKVGFTSLSLLAKNVLPDISESAIRRYLQKLREQKLIESIKDISLKSGRGSKETIDILTLDGLIALQKNKQQIDNYNKRLKRIPKAHIRHYIEVQKAQMSINKALRDNKLTSESCNEFSANNLKKLHINLKLHGENSPLRSDAEIKVYNQENQICTMKLEIDMGTEVLDIIIEKFDKYARFFKSKIVHSHTKTFPILIIFIATSEQRIFNILQRIKKHKARHTILFVPMKKLYMSNVFLDSIFINYSKSYISLSQILTQRENILNFYNAVQVAKEKQNLYEIEVYNIFTSLPYPLFPIQFQTYNTAVDFCPDAYIRIRKKCSSTGGLKEVFFALIISASTNNFTKTMAIYNAFLSQKKLREQVTSLDECLGSIIIVNDQKQLNKVLNMTKENNMQNIRAVLNINCKPEKILTSPILIRKEDTSVSLFPKAVISHIKKDPLEKQNFQ